MPADIRLCTSFPTHRKTQKLCRRLGPAAVLSLIQLWTHTREFRPDGILSDMDVEDIEIAAGWSGDPGRFVADCLDIGWLDRDDAQGPYECHDWADHQHWAIGEEVRGDSARFRRLKQVAPSEYQRLKDEGVTSISKPEYEALRKVHRLTAGKQPAISQEKEGGQPAPLLTLPNLNLETERPSSLATVVIEATASEAAPDSERASETASQSAIREAVKRHEQFIRRKWPDIDIGLETEKMVSKCRSGPIMDPDQFVLAWFPRAKPVRAVLSADQVEAHNDKVAAEFLGGTGDRGG